jgi:hypothetical protein
MIILPHLIILLVIRVVMKEKGERICFRRVSKVESKDWV